MEHQNDFSLLRPFDLEAARRGEPICFIDGDGPLELVADAVECRGYICVKWGENKNTSLAHKATTYPQAGIRMAPLAWVEGRPVYKGDTLYFGSDANYPGTEFKVSGLNKKGESRLDGTATFVDGEVMVRHERISTLTWTKPPRKVKREGWGVVRVNRLSATRAEADEILKQNKGLCPLSDLMDGEPRVARIEWEEEVAT